MKLALAGLVVALGCLVSLSASAVSSVSLLWTGSSGAGATGGTSITAQNGDILDATLFIHADAAGLSAYDISLFFDESLDNELDLFSVTHLDPPGWSPISTSAGSPFSTQESTSSVRGEVLRLNGTTPLSNRGVLTNTSFAVANIQFLVVNAANDGPDITGAVPNLGGGLLDANFNYSEPPPVTLSVRPGRPQPGGGLIPEPSAAILFGIGFAVAAGSRRLRR